MVKKLLKVLGIVVLVLLAIPLVTLAVFWTRNRLYRSSADAGRVEYLRQHAHVLLSAGEVHIDEGSLADAGNDRVFLLGESHGMADVQRIDAALFIHLNRKYGVRYYVAEIDSVRARELNTYLSAAQQDQQLLRSTVLAIGRAIPQQSSQGLMDKWSALYDHNRTLPDSLRMHVIGVDQDYDATADTIPRERAFFLNFRNAVQQQGLEGERFYGLFGYYHVLQGPMAQGHLPFAAQLKAEGIAVRSILCHAVDSEVRMPPNDQFPTPPDEKLGMLNSDGPILVLNGIMDLVEASAPNKVTLFDLDEEGSPYRTGQQLVRKRINLMGEDIVPATAETPTTAYYQHAVLLRNSEALTPVK